MAGASRDLSREAGSLVWNPTLAQEDGSHNGSDGGSQRNGTHLDTGPGGRNGKGPGASRSRLPPDRQVGGTEVTGNGFSAPWTAAGALGP